MKYEVMEREVSHKKKKFVYLKAYENLTDIHTAIKTVRECPNKFQLSVLKKISDKYISENGFIEKETIKPKYWSGILGQTSEQGKFTSPEAGRVFIVGSLTSLFLHKIDDKPLGEMTTGIYGILRGLGFHKNTVELIMKNLKSLHYILIIRGENDQLKKVQELLEI